MQAAAHLVAQARGFWGVLSSDPTHPVVCAWWMNVAWTGIVFALSWFHNSSSWYDPYWSVFTFVTAAYYTAYQAGGAASLGPRQLLILSLVAVYAARLTWNWWRGLGREMILGKAAGGGGGGHGGGHASAVPGGPPEDWRYIEVRSWPGLGEWWNGVIWWGVSSPLTIHLFPTWLIFVGCLPLYFALAVPVTAQAPLSYVDAVAAAVTATGILLEGFADAQLAAFHARASTASRRKPEVCRDGLWAYSRHPNYLGEMTFWLGLWAFGMAAAPSAAGFSIVGFLQIVSLFVSTSIPWMEARQLKRRGAAFAAYQREVPVLLPIKLW